MRGCSSVHDIWTGLSPETILFLWKHFSFSQLYFLKYLINATLVLNPKYDMVFQKYCTNYEYSKFIELQNNNIPAIAR